MASLRYPLYNAPLVIPTELESRHDYYETDEKVTLSIFDRGADPAQLSVVFEPRKVFHPLLASTPARSPGPCSLLTHTAIKPLYLNHSRARLIPMQVILQWVKPRSRSG